MDFVASLLRINFKIVKVVIKIRPAPIIASPRFQKNSDRSSLQIAVTVIGLRTRNLSSGLDV